MPKLTSFNFISLNGFYKGPNEDISWSKRDPDPEGAAYAAEGLGSGSTLLFGRVTYQMMASYWQSPMATQNDPVVAAGMNKASKIVFSRTLQNADWSNTRIIKDNLTEEVRKLKNSTKKGLTILGSGSLLRQLADEGLIDEYQLLLNPVALGEGATLFKGIQHNLNLKLKSTRAFKNGNVLLCYEPQI